MVEKRLGIFLAILALIAFAGFTSAAGVCSDVNQDGFVNGYDVDDLIDYAFRGGELPQGDVDLNDDGFPDVIDVVLLIDCVYRSDSGEVCLETNNLGDDEKENVYHDGENSLQTVLDNLGYYFDVDNDQQNTQTWLANNDLEIEITFLKTISSYKHEFGYYADSDPESFQEIFDNTEIEEGDSFIINISEDERFGFGAEIKDLDNGVFSENFLNADQKDRVLVFKDGSDFILAFEDWVDYDYQDLVVRVKLLSCGGEEPYCGDNITHFDSGEQCDFGSENGLVCDPGNEAFCVYCSSTCQLERVNNQCGETQPCCGDGIINGTEECDDGNVVNGDGCNNQCMNEYCGDNAVNNNGTEECDDGNLIDGDGCSSTCQIETIIPVCGNNITEQGEQCDQGTQNGKVCDNTNNDCSYCSLTCQIINREEDRDNNGDDDDNEFKIAEFMMSTCNPNWECTGWSECYNGVQTRTCEDTNNCGFEYNKPFEQTSCERLESVLIEKEKSSFPFWLLILMALIILIIIMIIVNWR
jgi:cysteine-rich repeat protein